MTGKQNLDHPRVYKLGKELRFFYSKGSRKLLYILSDT